MKETMKGAVDVFENKLADTKSDMASLSRKEAIARNKAEILSRTAEAQEMVDELREEMLSWINKTIDETSINDQADIEALCILIDDKIREMRPRFIAIYEKSARDVKSNKVWKAFNGELRSLRKRVKAELFEQLSSGDELHVEGVPSKVLDEVKTQASAPDEDSETTAEPQVEKPKSASEYGEDEVMELMESYEEQIKELKDKLAQSQEKSDQFDDLEAELNRIKNVVGSLTAELEEQVEVWEEQEARIDELESSVAVKENTIKALQDQQEEGREDEPLEAESFEDRKKEFQERLEELQEDLLDLGEIFTETADWIEWGEDQLVRVLPQEIASLEAKKRLYSADKAVNASLEHKKSFRSIVAQKLEEARSLMAQLSEQDTKTQGDVKRIKQAIDVLDSFVSHAPLPERPDIAAFDIELPSHEDLARSAEVTQEIPVIRPEAIDPSETVSVGGLPFTVEFNRGDVKDIEDLEATIEEYEGTPVDELRQQLPFETDNQALTDTYERLLSDLSDGSFVERIKLAVVMLGAARDGDEFSGRRSGGTFLARARSKAVALARDISHAAELLSSVHRELDMVRKLNPAINILHKVGKTHKFGGQAAKLTRLGEIASQVWTKELLEEGIVQKEQLAAFHAAYNKSEE